MANSKAGEKNGISGETEEKRQTLSTGIMPERLQLD